MAVCLRAGSAATLVADEKNMLGDISSQLSFPITHTNTLPSTSSAPISVRDRRRAGALSMTGLDHLWQFWFDVTSPLPTRRLSERLKGNCVTLAWRGGSRFVSEWGASWDGGCVCVCGSYKWPPFPKPLRSPLWNASPRGRRGCVGNGSWEKGSLSLRGHVVTTQVVWYQSEIWPSSHHYLLVCEWLYVCVRMHPILFCQTSAMHCNMLHTWVYTEAKVDWSFKWCQQHHALFENINARSLRQYKSKQQ